jgi:rSAM/selenodomain-associated transferase 1
MAESRLQRSPGATLAVLAKAPIPGFAKTRLVPRLGRAGAAELHAVLLERTLRAAASSGFEHVALWCAPGRRSPYFDGLREATGFVLRDQPEGDLGARMLAAFELHLAAGGPVLLVGTDCPELNAGHLESARLALSSGADTVLLPAVDGGYAAIGLTRLDRSLFEEMAWGSPEVLAATRERIRRLGWVALELPVLRDVDVPDDVEWLLSSGLLTSAERARLEPYLGVDATWRAGYS